jgi:hypothetical protein
MDGAGNACWPALVASYNQGWWFSTTRESRRLLDVSDVFSKMSDMNSERITIRISGPLGAKLRKRSVLQGRPESELVRDALEAYLDQEGNSAFDLATVAGLVGCLEKAPKDLSTNPQYLEGFGKSQ